MSATLTILLLWLAFAATHMTLASVQLRPKLVARLGERPYIALYSALSLVLFVALVWVYFANKHAGPLLWNLPKNDLLEVIVILGNAVAFVLFASAFVQPSPTGMATSETDPRGVLLITRHPLFMAIAIWSAFHLLPNGSTADVAFFGGMVAFTLLGAWHQDRRKLETEPPEFKEFYASTPFLPFTGRRTGQGLRQLSPSAIAIGIALTVFLRYFHSSFFGP
jgi:uncharacterized membrane protein